MVTIEQQNKIREIYHEYVKEVLDIKDIKKWCSKRTITEKVMTSERTNETKVKDAISDSEYKESDKIWVFFKSDDSLCLAEKFDGDYNKDRLLKQLYSSVQIFESVLPTDDLFINYSLKRSKKLLEVL